MIPNDWIFFTRFTQTSKWSDIHQHNSRELDWMRMNVLRKKRPVWVVSAAQKSSKGDKNLEITLKNMVVWNWQHLFTVKGGADRFKNIEDRASQACQDTLITDNSCMSATWAREIRGKLYKSLNAELLHDSLCEDTPHEQSVVRGERKPHKRRSKPVIIPI